MELRINDTTIILPAELAASCSLFAPYQAQSQITISSENITLAQLQGLVTAWNDLTTNRSGVADDWLEQLRIADYVGCDRLFQHYLEELASSQYSEAAIGAALKGVGADLRLAIERRLCQTYRQTISLPIQPRVLSADGSRFLGTNLALYILVDREYIVQKWMQEERGEYFFKGEELWWYRCEEDRLILTNTTSGVEHRYQDVPSGVIQMYFGGQLLTITYLQEGIIGRHYIDVRSGIYYQNLPTTAYLTPEILTYPRNLPVANFYRCSPNWRYRLCYHPGQPLYSIDLANGNRFLYHSQLLQTARHTGEGLKFLDSNNRQHILAITNHTILWACGNTIRELPLLQEQQLEWLSGRIVYVNQTMEQILDCRVLTDDNLLLRYYPQRSTAAARVLVRRGSKFST